MYYNCKTIPNCFTFYIVNKLYLKFKRDLDVIVIGKMMLMKVHAIFMTVELELLNLEMDPRKIRGTLIYLEVNLLQITLKGMELL